MSRYIDADKLMKELPKEYLGSTVHGLINSAPTIKTKQVKYYDEDENVWKIGEVIVRDSEKPNNSMERSSE